MGALQLRCVLVAFHNVLGWHDGENLAAIAIALMDRAEMMAKVCWHVDQTFV
jgi:hypothetical protein